MKKLTYLGLMGVVCVLMSCGGTATDEGVEGTQPVADTTAVESVKSPVENSTPEEINDVDAK